MGTSHVIQFEPDADALVQYIRPRKALVDEALDLHLPAADAEPQQVHAAMRHAVLAGGKRLRPILAIAVSEVAGAAPDHVLRSACALECVHAASLILDDLPCMDNAVARRGLPCTHVQYGEATALLSVMGLIALAFDLVASDAAQQHAPNAVRQLAAAIGTAGLVRGQHGDLRATGPGIPSLTSVEAAHRHKTGALFLAAVQIPASLVGMADADALALETYARNIGLAFQIADDVRDSTVRDSTVRNIASEDADKCTFVTHLGVEGARDKTGELLADALRALDGFGPRAEPLRLLAHYVRTLAQ